MSRLKEKCGHHGANSGIGLASAKTVRRGGAHVYITGADRRN